MYFCNDDSRLLATYTMTCAVTWGPSPILTISPPLIAIAYVRSEPCWLNDLAPALRMNKVGMHQPKPVAWYISNHMPVVSEMPGCFKSPGNMPGGNSGNLLLDFFSMVTSITVSSFQLVSFVVFVVFVMMMEV